MNTKGWTVDTALEHLLAIIRESDRRYEQRFTAHEEAVGRALTSHEHAAEKAERVTEKRFEAIDEFRQALSDAYGSMMPRTESEAARGAILEKIDLLSSRVGANVPRLEVDAKIKGIEDQVALLVQRMERSEGRNQGLSRGWAVLLGAFGLLATIAGLLGAFHK